jgi:RNA polymerase sigma factor (sigma-70 family)
MRVPDPIAHLDARAGHEWTPEEFAYLVAWWSERDQEKLVWYCAARFLGKSAAREDVEEVWLDFYKTIIPRARASYRPGGSSFCTYLLDVCFKNHCVQRRRRLDLLQQREVLWTEAKTVALSLRAAQSTDQPGGDPFQRAEQQAFLGVLNTALNDTAIRPLHRDAFLLRHVEQLSYLEIAHALNVPEGTARVWVHRVTARIAVHLRNEGWGE